MANSGHWPDQVVTVNDNPYSFGSLANGHLAIAIGD
jgi:hypothetical protein